jgi:hypothetical protein
LKKLARDKRSSFYIAALVLDEKKVLKLTLGAWTINLFTGAIVAES